MGRDEVNELGHQIKETVLAGLFDNSYDFTSIEFHRNAHGCFNGAITVCVSKGNEKASFKSVGLYDAIYSAQRTVDQQIADKKAALLKDKAEKAALLND